MSHAQRPSQEFDAVLGHNILFREILGCLTKINVWALSTIFFDLLFSEAPVRDLKESCSAYF